MGYMAAQSSGLSLIVVMGIKEPPRENKRIADKIKSRRHTCGCRQYLGFPCAHLRLCAGHAQSERESAEMGRR